MSHQIHVLPTLVANQIAAGEVVERPASIIKELVENALDAQASSLVLEIEDGGKSLISIRDNGTGIAKDQLDLALAPHATSKLYSLEDLNHIASYGFRGEALASISSVSKLSLISRQADSEAGWKIYNEGKEYRTASQPVAHPVGTTIQVAELFYNTPARQKFLKSGNVEYNHIEDLIKRLAIVRPEIDWTVSHNGKQKLRFPGLATGEYKERILQVLPKVFTDQAVVVTASIPTFNLQMELVVELNQIFTNRNNMIQYSYINNRLIKDKVIISALKQVLTELCGHVNLSYVLFLTIDPQVLDVNVHPAKAEVRFHDAHLVHSFIFQNAYLQLAHQRHLSKQHIDQVLSSRHEDQSLIDHSQLTSLLQALTAKQDALKAQHAQITADLKAQVSHKLTVDKDLKSSDQSNSDQLDLEAKIQQVVQNNFYQQTRSHGASQPDQYLGTDQQEIMERLNQQFAQSQQHSAKSDIVSNSLDPDQLSKLKLGSHTSLKDWAQQFTKQQSAGSASSKPHQHPSTATSHTLDAHNVAHHKESEQAPEQSIVTTNPTIASKFGFNKSAVLQQLQQQRATQDLYQQLSQEVAVNFTHTPSTHQSLAPQHLDNQVTDTVADKDPDLVKLQALEQLTSLPASVQSQLEQNLDYLLADDELESDQAPTTTNLTTQIPNTRASTDNEISTGAVTDNHTTVTSNTTSQQVMSSIITNTSLTTLAQASNQQLEQFRKQAQLSLLEFYLPLTIELLTHKPLTTVLAQLTPVADSTNTHNSANINSENSDCTNRSIKHSSTSDTSIGSSSKDVQTSQDLQQQAQPQDEATKTNLTQFLPELIQLVSSLLTQETDTTQTPVATPVEDPVATVLTASATHKPKNSAPATTSLTTQFVPTVVDLALLDFSLLVSFTSEYFTQELVGLLQRVPHSNPAFNQAIPATWHSLRPQSSTPHTQQTTEITSSTMDKSVESVPNQHLTTDSLLPTWLVTHATTQAQILTANTQQTLVQVQSASQAPQVVLIANKKLIQVLAITMHELVQQWQQLIQQVLSCITSNANDATNIHTNSDQDTVAKQGSLANQQELQIWLAQLPENTTTLVDTLTQVQHNLQLLDQFLIAQQLKFAQPVCYAYCLQLMTDLGIFKLPSLVRLIQQQSYTIM